MKFVSVTILMPVLLASTYFPGKEGEMATRKILVPYNFTQNDEKAVAFVIDSFGHQADAQITLFHTYIPVPDIEVSDLTIMVNIQPTRISQIRMLAVV